MVEDLNLTRVLAAALVILALTVPIVPGFTYAALLVVMAVALRRRLRAAWWLLLIWWLVLPEIGRLVSLASDVRVATVVGVGEQANAMIEKFWTARGDVSSDVRDRPDAEQDLIWTSTEGLRSIALKRPEARQKRHIRKYAEGELGKDKSF